MEPRNQTVNELFSSSTVYEVPRYQRLYVWNMEDQWGPLWEDVIGIANDLFNYTLKVGSTEINGDTTESHFFGTIVLKQRGHTPDMAMRYRVIDGQQRLTTLQLMMSAVADELTKLDLTEHAEPVRNLNTNSNQTVKFEPKKLKIVHGSDHYAGFVDTMNPKKDKSDIPGSMGDCYRFYCESVKNWFKDHGNALELRAVALTTSILIKLRLVAIYLAPHEEEHKIFETLNARGKPLTEWDKIKNFLLYKADESVETDQDDFFDEYIDFFDQAWWRETVGRGAKNRPRSDVFADYWLESKTANAVGSNRVFREFQKYVNVNSSDLNDIGQELIRDAEYFSSKEKNSKVSDSAENRFHYRRIQIGIGAWWPMVFVLNRFISTRMVDGCIRDQVYSLLESYLVRRVVVGYSARSYDQVGFDLIKLALEEVNDPNSLAEEIRQRLLGYTQASNLWPDDGEVHTAVMTRRFPSYVSRIVLESIEDSLIPREAGYQSVSKVEVEHIMPQSWATSSWPLTEDSHENDAITNRNAKIHSLGNLTLINSGLNKRLSNRSWKYKQKLIAKSDNLFLNKQLLEDSPETWNECQIEERGKWMANVICGIWPRPNNSHSL